MRLIYQSGGNLDNGLAWNENGEIDIDDNDLDKSGDGINKQVSALAVMKEKWYNFKLNKKNRLLIFETQVIK